MPLAIAPFSPPAGPLAGLPLLHLEQARGVLQVRLNRPAKRNSINDGLLAQLHAVHVNGPADISAAVLNGAAAKERVRAFLDRPAHKVDQP